MNKISKQSDAGGSEKESFDLSPLAGFKMEELVEEAMTREGYAIVIGYCRLDELKDNHGEDTWRIRGAGPLPVRIALARIIGKAVEKSLREQMSDGE